MPIKRVVNNQEPKSVDELVEFITRCVRENYEKTGRGLDGSLLAYLVQREYPALDYIKLGLTKLGDAVRIAVGREQLTRNPSVRHLEVLPAQLETAPPAASNDTTNRGLLFVRPDLWRALVLWAPNSRAFFNRTTGELSEIDSMMSPD
jgi:hypothetical protein